MRKNLIALSLAAGIGLASTSASAIVISGIDFGPSGNTTHLETMTLAQQFINPTSTLPGTGSGMGYGLVTTINGNTDYCSASANCALFYTVEFTGGTFLSGTELVFTGTNVNLFLLDPSINLFNADSPTNLATIQGGTLYASLIGHGNIDPSLDPNVVSYAAGTLSGSSLNILGNGLLDVVAGVGNLAFASFLDGNGIADAAPVPGFADLAYTESANNVVLNPFDVANGLAIGCGTGEAATGEWCWQGTLNSRGIPNIPTTEVPEPGSLALMSLGLLAGGLIRRRKTS